MAEKDTVAPGYSRTSMAGIPPRPTPVRTVLEVVRLSTGYLRDGGGGSPRLDAELLVSHALGLGRIDLYLQHERPLDGGELAAIRELLRRRARGEPVAYLTGTREFYGRAFTVSPSVLIPRPETETLVRQALAFARSRAGALLVADLGTGSGCVACTLAAELPEASVVACDVSAAALEVAAGNARTLGVAERVTVVEGGWEAGLPTGADLVISNPPYVTSTEMEALPRDVGFEPRLALDGGADGLDAYRALLPAARGRCPRLAWVGVEVDSRRAEAVAGIARSLWPGAAVSVTDDLSRRPRVVEVRP
jgi:release factor glutamine methyltransferase